MRNPLESWDKSDSKFGIDTFYDCTADWEVAELYCKYNDIPVEDNNYDYDAIEKYSIWLVDNGILKTQMSYTDCFKYAFLGPKDLNLAQRMIKAGTSDSKFMRQIFVSVDITAPLYWWK